MISQWPPPWSSITHFILFSAPSSPMNHKTESVLFFSTWFRLFRITCLRIPYTSRWLYVGTERGNVYMVSVESFVISGYVINWNKAIPLYVILFNINCYFYRVIGCYETVSRKLKPAEHEKRIIITSIDI